MPPVLALRELTVWRQRHDSPPQRVVHGLSLELRAGERLALVGANGAGKTSLLLSVVGAAPFEGSILHQDEELTRSTLASARERTGYVFSDPADQLFLPTVWQEVAFGPEARGVSGAELEDRVTSALRSVQLEGLERRAPQELSLGEQRRLAVATVLAIRPALVLLDEPTASLDPVARRQMLRAMKETDASVLFASHDLEAALELDARVAVMHQGTLAALGAARELLADPQLMERAGLEVPLSIRLRSRPNGQA